VVLKIRTAHNVQTLKKIKRTFESMGIEFIEIPDNGSGLRWKPKAWIRLAI
jgi:hypothetical protein